jgi:hypothetical protein
MEPAVGRSHERNSLEGSGLESTSPGLRVQLAARDSECQEPHDKCSLGIPALVDGVWPDVHAVRLVRRHFLADGHCAAIGKPRIDRSALLRSPPRSCQGWPACMSAISCPIASRRCSTCIARSFFQVLACSSIASFDRLCSRREAFCLPQPGLAPEA